MVMPSQVASAFIVIKPQLLFELLIALLDPPPYFGKKDKAAKACLCGQIGEPILGGLRLPFGPLNTQPLPGGPAFDLSRSMSRQHSDRSKTRNKSAFSSFAPFDCLPHPSRQLQSKIFDRKNSQIVCLAVGRRIADTIPCLARFIKDNGLCFYFGNIEKPTINQTLPKGVSVTISAVTNNNTFWDFPAKRLIDQIQSNLPFRLKGISVWNACILHPQWVIRPSFWKIEL